jgi:hypothetical protein
MFKTCFDAKIHFPIDTECCESCHQDWEDYNIEMSIFEFNENEYHVCCKVKDAFLKLKIKI